MALPWASPTLAAPGASAGNSAVCGAAHCTASTEGASPGHLCLAAHLDAALADNHDEELVGSQPPPFLLALALAPAPSLLGTATPP